MEPQERGRGEGKEEGKGERRIMAELLTAPWIAKEDFLHQCAGVGTSAGAHQHTPCSYLGGCVGQSGSKNHPEHHAQGGKTGLCIPSDFKWKEEAAGTSDS